MRVFVTGATGFVGTELVRELVQGGHEVLGLARSVDAEATLACLGANALRGDLEDLESLRGGADACDAVVHLGFNPDFSKMRESSEVDRQAIEAIGSAINGSNRPFVVPNGIAGLKPSGPVITEQDDIPPDYAFPRASEQTALRLVAQGVHASVVRFPQVHSTKKQGLVTRLTQIARSTGVAAYVGDGSNRWPAAHVEDVAELIRLILEKGEAGAKYHAVAEEGIAVRAISDAIGRALNIPTKSLSADDAKQHFGPLAMFVGEDMPASAKTTMAALGWRPSGPTLLADLEQGGGPAAP